MLIPSSQIMTLLNAFAQVFDPRVWQSAVVLVIGAILAPGKRTVSAVLTAVGLADDRQFQRFHRVLNRARWSGLEVSQILLGLLVTAFVPVESEIVIAADETLERRQGKAIRAKGVFRDAVRSSETYTVLAFGLRWVSLMLLVRVPWSQRVWALPFLTVLAPNAAYHASQNRRHKTSIDWLMQMLCQVRRWLRGRRLVLVVDGGLMALKLAHLCRCETVDTTLVGRLRLDAQLYAPPLPQPKSKPGRKPKKGPRLPSLKDRLTDPEANWQSLWMTWYDGQPRLLEVLSDTALWYTSGQDPLPMRWVLVRDPAGKLAPAAFLCTDLNASPDQVLHWYLMRWSVEVTFEETRAHLGLETQRQFSDLAIARTTPILLGLYSLVTLLADHLLGSDPLPVRTTAWYHKSEATFSDALAYVRRDLWTTTEFHTSLPNTLTASIPQAVLRGFVDLLCYAA